MKRLIFVFLISILGLNSFLTELNAKLPAEEQLIQDIREILTPQAKSLESYPADFHPVCATPSFVWLLGHRDELSPEAQKELSSLMPARPSYTTIKKTYDTPSGHFKIHYVTSTIDSVYKSSIDTLPADGHPDYVNFVGEIMDFMWRKEVDTLGYLSPPSDDWYPPGEDKGGDGKYDVYLKWLDTLYLGYTQPEAYVPPAYKTATSFIVLRNDYSLYAPYRPDFNDFLRVTSAHEFFHASQFGHDADEYEHVPSDPITPVRPYWMEITATWMEDVVYDNINDYLNYLPYFYNYPWLSLKTFSRDATDLPRYYHAYAACVWAFYLSEKFGLNTVKDIWYRCSLIQGDNVLTATNEVLTSLGSSFDQAFREFSVWNFFTGSRADTLLYYSEGKRYPVVKVAPTQVHYSYPVNVTTVPYPPEVLGTNYIRFVNDVTPGGLNLHFDGADAANWKTSVIGYSSANPDYFAEFSLDAQKKGDLEFHNWNMYDNVIMIPIVTTKTSGSFGYSYSAIYDSTLTSVEEQKDLLPYSFSLSQNYPNPFNPATTIPFKVYSSRFMVHSPIHTTLKIYNIKGQLVRTLMDEERVPGDHNIVWDGKDNSGTEVASGIYLYQLKSGDYTSTRKMLLLR